MKKFIEKMQRAANKFTVVDYACFKIYMISVGVLLGVYFALFLRIYINAIWSVAILAGLFTILRLVENYQNLK